MELTAINRPLISAIIPIAGFPNGTEQINAWVSDPSLTDFEIILVVDSDSNETREQVATIANQIRLITKVSILKSDFRNPGGTRNLGLNVAGAKWVTFWDCDDIPHPSKYVELVRMAERDSAEIALGAFTLHSSTSSRNYEITSSSRMEIFASIATNPGLWRFVIKSDLAKTHHFPQLKMGEDQIYLAGVLSNTQKIKYSNANLYEYWLYQSGQLTKNGTAIKDLDATFEFFLDLFDKQKCEPVSIVLNRLLITSVKKGGIKLSIVITLKYLKLIIGKPSSMALFFQGFKKIWQLK